VAGQGGECDVISHGTLIQSGIDMTVVGTNGLEYQVQRQIIVAVAQAHNLHKDKKDHDARDLNVTKQGTRSA
jgi:hypothetical protein